MWFECCMCFLVMGLNQIKMQTSYEIATTKNNRFLNVERLVVGDVHVFP